MDLKQPHAPSLFDTTKQCSTKTIVVSARLVFYLTTKYHQYCIIISTINKYKNTKIDYI